MTAAFREARDLAGINVEPGRRPHTYHKLRGLRTRLHMQQGDNPQALASRKDAATTAVYADSRGAFEPLRLVAGDLRHRARHGERLFQGLADDVTGSFCAKLNAVFHLGRGVR